MDYASFVDYFPETEVLIFEESDCPVLAYLASTVP